MPKYDYLQEQAHQSRRKRLNNQQLGSALRGANLAADLRSAYLPATNPAVGDPLNIMGSQIGRIGRRPDEPLPPPTKPYHQVPGQMDGVVSVPGGGVGGPGLRMPGHNAFSGGFQAQPSAGDKWAARNPNPYPAGSPLRLGVKNPDVRSGSNKDALKIAQNRARAGMSLNEDEKHFLGTPDGTVPISISANAPTAVAPSLQDVLAGSFAERQTQAKETVRQRGLARGDARAQARNYREMTAPRNVRMGDGSTVSRPGMPAGLAAYSNAPAGGSLREILGYGAEGAARLGVGRLEADATLRGKSMDNETDIKKANILKDIAAMEAGKGAGAPPTPEDGPQLDLGNDDLLALQNREGNDGAIEQYGRTKGWSDDKIAAVKRQYGEGPLKKAARAAGGAMFSAPATAGAALHKWWNKPKAPAGRRPYGLMGGGTP